jgi:hypothetical protein
MVYRADGELFNNLRRVKEEVGRIEREFMGAVNLVLSQPPWFRVSDLISRLHLFFTCPSGLNLCLYEPTGYAFASFDRLFTWVLTSG